MDFLKELNERSFKYKLIKNNDEYYIKIFDSKTDKVRFELKTEIFAEIENFVKNVVLSPKRLVLIRKRKKYRLKKDISVLTTHNDRYVLHKNDVFYIVGSNSLIVNEHMLTNLKQTGIFADNFVIPNSVIEDSQDDSMLYIEQFHMDYLFDILNIKDIRNERIFINLFTYKLTRNIDGTEIFYRLKFKKLVSAYNIEDKLIELNGKMYLKYKINIESKYSNVLGFINERISNGNN